MDRKIDGEKDRWIERQIDRQIDRNIEIGYTAMMIFSN